MLGRNWPHEISARLDLTLENVVTVTDVIASEYAHQPGRLASSPLVTGARQLPDVMLLRRPSHLGITRFLLLCYT